MNIEIYSIGQSEVDAFWGLFAEVLQAEFPGYTKKVLHFMIDKVYTRNAYQYWLSQSMKTVFLATAEHEPVGFAVIDDPYGGVSFCRWLGIKKDYQRKGIGTKLITMWLDHAKATGCHKAEVAAQPIARAFYKKVGLKEEGKRELSYFGIDQYVFGKVLGTPNESVMTNHL